MPPSPRHGRDRLKLLPGSTGINLACGKARALSHLGGGAFRQLAAIDDQHRHFVLRIDRQIIGRHVLALAEVQRLHLERGIRLGQRNVRRQRSAGGRREGLRRLVWRASWHWQCYALAHDEATGTGHRQGARTVRVGAGCRRRRAVCASAGRTGPAPELTPEQIADVNRIRDDLRSGPDAARSRLPKPPRSGKHAVYGVRYNRRPAAYRRNPLLHQREIQWRQHAWLRMRSASVQLGGSPQIGHPEPPEQSGLGARDGAVDGFALCHRP